MLHLYLQLHIFYDWSELDNFAQRILLAWRMELFIRFVLHPKHAHNSWTQHSFHGYEPLATYWIDCCLYYWFMADPFLLDAHLQKARILRVFDRRNNQWHGFIPSSCSDSYFYVCKCTLYSCSSALKCWSDKSNQYDRFFQHNSHNSWF